MEIIHVFYMMLLLVFLVVVMVYLKKHGSLLKIKQGNINELERFYYSPKSYLSVMKIENEIFVLGVTENNINYLKELKDKETLDKLKLNTEKDKKNENGFSDILKLRQSSMDGLKNRLEKMRANPNEEA